MMGGVCRGLQGFPGSVSPLARGPERAMGGVCRGFRGVSGAAFLARKSERAMAFRSGGSPAPDDGRGFEGFMGLYILTRETVKNDNSYKGRESTPHNPGNPSRPVVMRAKGTRCPLVPAAGAPLVAGHDWTSSHRREEVSVPLGNGTRGQVLSGSFLGGPSRVIRERDFRLVRGYFFGGDGRAG